jgi:hypothetical protein
MGLFSLQRPEKAEGVFVAAPHANPEWTPTAAKRFRYEAPISPPLHHRQIGQQQKLAPTGAQSC